MQERPLVLVRVGSNDLTIEGEIRAMKISETQQSTIEWGKPINKKTGKPAKVEEGTVTIVCSDGSATVEQDPANPFKALIKGASAHGEGEAATLTISADADTGEGVNEITDSVPLLVTEAGATGFGPATEGTPEEQP